MALGSGPSLCFLPACILWRDGEWWRITQAVGLRFDSSGSATQWRHTRPGPNTCWENVLIHCFGDWWKERASTKEWHTTHAQFILASYSRLGRRSLEDQYAQNPATLGDRLQPPLKRPRLVAHQAVKWDLGGASHRVEILGDSLLVINWAMGVWYPRFLPYLRRMIKVQRMFEGMLDSGMVMPRTDASDIFRHIYRELNAEADRLAGSSTPSEVFPYMDPMPYLRFQFDGSSTKDRSGCGWILYGSASVQEDVKLSGMSWLGIL